MENHKNKSTKEEKIHTFSLGEKEVLWFSAVNKYVVAQPGIDEIVKLIWEGAPEESILATCKKIFEVDVAQAKKMKDDFTNYIHENIRRHRLTYSTREKYAPTHFCNEKTISKKYYIINNAVFFVEYESEQARELSHPKFAHLETEPTELFHHHFKVFHSGGWFTLEVDRRTIGSWKESDSHFLGGKFSMQILQKLNNTEEEDWLGVFHAAGVTDGNNCILFYGDSGNGKSTLSAILMAHGLDVLSDDFLPVESKSMLACRFPAAVSIKKNAYEIISKQFPEINSAREYQQPGMNKTFKYLPVFKSDNLKVPCKALVFVHYRENAGFQLSEMSREVAFQQLVPDSWISPEPENAKRFIEWFNKIPCYRLVYSDNNKMIQTIKKMFNRELS